MKPCLVEEPPVGDGWIHELKYDGYRTQLIVDGPDLRAYTSKGFDWTHLYGSILNQLPALSARSALLDGEVIVQDERGRSDFHALQAELRKKKPQGLVFMAFDLLHLDGRDLRGEPVEDRRARLKDLLGGDGLGGRILFSDHVAGGGGEIFAAAEAAGLEGIVSKKLGSRYTSGTSKLWQKTKSFVEAEFVVIGAAEGDPIPQALLARETEDHRLVYVGSADVTPTQRERETFWRTMERLARDTPALHVDKAPKNSSWVRPEMRVRVRHLAGEERLRHASVKAITSLPATSSSKPPGSSKRSAEPIYKVGADAVPPQDLLLDYYSRVGPLMLPFVANRPLNLFRCPAHDAGECVFQRNRMHPPRPESFFPPPIRDVPILQKNGRTERYLYVDELEGLLACVRAETVEFHGWGSLVGDVEKPDRIAIDLDPHQGIGFEEVKRTAFEVRDHLGAIGLQSFPLLTGGKGLHVVVPLTPEAEWPEVHGFAQLFCATLAQAHPDRFTVESRMPRRRGRIFLDYLRNHRTATAVLPYSVRARPGAPVAAPVTWRELDEIDTPRRLTAADASELVRRGRKMRSWGVAGQRLPRL